MADEDQAPAEEPASADATNAAPERKELEGFQVTRSAPPPDEGGPPLGLIVIILALVVGSGVAFLNGDDAEPSGATTTGEPGAGQPGDEPPDVAVPDHVWERLDFLEGEGKWATAYDVAVEANKATPNAELRAKIKDYAKAAEIGEELSSAELLEEAAKQIAAADYDGAVESCDAVLEEEGDNAKALFLRGKAYGLNGDAAGGREDLETARALGYDPAEIDAVLETFEE